MIRLVKYSDIDFAKYNDCLMNAAQYKCYAERTYLDITAKKKWDLLVYNDYDAVMPLPYIKKMGIKFIVNPKLCQQLGIFSNSDSLEINDQFLEFLEKKFRIWYYAFNDKNSFSRSLVQRKNFLIPKDLYANIYKRYSPKRKRKLRLDQEVAENALVIEDIDFSDAASFVKENMLGVDKQKDLTEFLRIFEEFHRIDSLKFYGFRYHSKLVNLIAVHLSGSSATLLGTFNDKNFVKLSGASVLIDQAIKNYAENRIFDFEGSEIPAVEEFFRGFRPQLHPYPVIQNSRKDLVINLFRK